MSLNQTAQPEPVRLRPESTFTLQGEPTTLSVLDFWGWLASDLLSNALRGKVAEYIVARATGAQSDVRIEWDVVDVRTPEGIAVEVKSAAYLQAWHQTRPSAISFGIARTYPWDPMTNRYGEKKLRSAAVYVFCLLKHQDANSVDPLELSQWEFYVLPIARLESALGDQKSVSLSRIRVLGAEVLGYHQLAEAIRMSAHESNAHT